MTIIAPAVPVCAFCRASHSLAQENEFLVAVTEDHGEMAACEALWLHVKEGDRKICLPFCTPSCLLARLEQAPALDFDWFQHQDLFPMSERGDWTLNGCMTCCEEKEDAQYIVLSGAPWGSSFDDERPNAFCSQACLVRALHKEVKQFDENGLKPWYVRPWNSDAESQVEE